MHSFVYWIVAIWDKRMKMKVPRHKIKVRKSLLLRTLFLRRCWESCYNGAVYELIKMQIRTFKGIWQNGKQDHGGINTGPVQRDDRDNEDRGM